MKRKTLYPGWMQTTNEHWALNAEPVERRDPCNSREKKITNYMESANNKYRMEIELVRLCLAWGCHNSVQRSTKLCICTCIWCCRMHTTTSSGTAYITEVLCVSTAFPCCSSRCQGFSDARKGKMYIHCRWLLWHQRHAPNTRATTINVKYMYKTHTEIKHDRKHSRCAPLIQNQFDGTHKSRNNNNK